MELYNFNEFKQLQSKNYIELRENAILLYAEYLSETNLYEADVDTKILSQKELEAAEEKAKDEDYSGLAKIFKGILSKSKKVGIGILLISNILSGCHLNANKLSSAMQDEQINKTVIETVAKNIKTIEITEETSDLSKIGYKLSADIKEEDHSKGQYEKTPCYEYAFRFMKEINPSLGDNIMQGMKMTYKKDLNSLSGKESIEVSRNSLGDKSDLVTLKDLNAKHHFGKDITKAGDVKIGDIVNFWIYDLIEFSPKEGNYSYSDTKAKFEETHKDAKNDAGWYIESAKLVWGHYAVVSAVDADYIYLSSSGEKGGVNGIWNNVDKGETQEFLTKIKKSDFKLNDLKYEDILFKKTDDLTGTRSRVPLRISVVRVNE